MGMAERIKSQRIKCGYTQEELAEKLGMQKSAIAKYENGRVENIKRSTIQNMASILNCTPSYLMGWDEIILEERKSDPTNRLKLYNDAFSEIRSTNKKVTNNTIRIIFVDEPEISLHSKAAKKLVKIMKDMPEEDLEFLADTAKRISPDEKNNSNLISFQNTSSSPDYKSSEKFTDVNSAKEYLGSLGKSLSAFGGGKGLSDEAIIDMANILYNDAHK